MQKIPNNVCSYSTLKDVNITPTPYVWTAHTVLGKEQRYSGETLPQPGGQGQHEQ